MPTLYVLAGPNGCGKSTLARTTWFSRVEVIDPDAIARGMAPGSQGRAAREALRRRQVAIATGRTLLVETTLAGNTTLRLMETARAAGHRIVMHYMSVVSPELALHRIRNRVALGGHDVPEPDARRRFVRSLAKLPDAIARADETRLYDNTNPDQPFREVAALVGGTWWTAERIPGWTAAVIARMSSQPRL